MGRISTSFTAHLCVAAYFAIHREKPETKPLLMSMKQVAGKSGPGFSRKNLRKTNWWTHITVVFGGGDGHTRFLQLATFHGLRIATSTHSLSLIMKDWANYNQKNHEEMLI